jgi:urease accessory protein
MLSKLNRHMVLNNRAIAPLSFSLLLGINLFFVIPPALAHHAMGGKIPTNFAEGFLSGLAHPVIGIDHLVFVIAIGLLAATWQNSLGSSIPVVFTIATASGTGIHLLNVNLPVLEIIIAASVAIIGIFLARENRINLALLTALSAIAGIFHGYAYGEAIIGAEATALNAYLIGFMIIQLIISAIAFYLGQFMIQKATSQPNLILRFAGYTIFGIGLAFLSQATIG